MEILKIIFIVLFVIYGIFMFVFSLLEKRPLHTIFMFIVVGVLTLLVINLLSPLTKIGLPINTYTVLGSAGFGIPGVIALLILRIIFI